MCIRDDRNARSEKTEIPPANTSVPATKVGPVPGLRIPLRPANSPNPCVTSPQRLRSTAVSCSNPSRSGASRPPIVTKPATPITNNTTSERRSPAPTPHEIARRTAPRQHHAEADEDATDDDMAEPIEARGLRYMDRSMGARPVRRKSLDGGKIGNSNGEHPRAETALRSPRFTTSDSAPMTQKLVA